MNGRVAECDWKTKYTDYYFFIFIVTKNSV